MDTVKSFFKPNSKTKVIPKPPRKVRFDLPSSSAVNTKSGDEIVKLLSRENSPSTKPPRKIVQQAPKMSQQEINNRVLQIMSDGKIN